MSDFNLPFISVIVPVFNDEKRIGKCIESLLNQTYPKDKFEVIIVDNNSYDKTIEIIKEYPVKLLRENKIQSSYAARNLGVKSSRGDILVFTDSDCVADKNWLRGGINHILKNNCDFLVGDVKFFYKNKNSVFEILDSFVHFNQEKSALNGRVATVNVFFKKNIFEKIGFFDQSVKSGADTIFSRTAIQKGFVCEFCSNALVWHPARGFKELVLKQKRVGYYSVYNMLSLGRSILYVVFRIFLDFLPQKKFFYRAIKNIDHDNKIILGIKLFFANWLMLSIANFYRLVYLRDLIFKNISNEKNKRYNSSLQ